MRNANLFLILGTEGNGNLRKLFFPIHLGNEREWGGLKKSDFLLVIFSKIIASEAEWSVEIGERIVDLF